MLSPDGKQLATLFPVRCRPTTEPYDQAPHATLHVRGIDEKEPGTSLGVECQMFVWSPDGTEIVCCDFVDGPDKKTWTRPTSS